MLDLLCPDACYRSVLEIDLDALRQRDIEGLILDLDNTLVGWGESAISGDVAAWVTKAKAEGFRLCIASNGLSERVRTLAHRLDIPAIPKAEKPRKRPFRRALRVLQARADQAAVIGDQVFTDVLGGNRLAIYTILINPLSQKELRSTRLVRRVERRILQRLNKKGLLSAAAVETRAGAYQKR